MCVLTTFTTCTIRTMQPLGMWSRIHSKLKLFFSIRSIRLSTVFSILQQLTVFRKFVCGKRFDSTELRIRSDSSIKFITCRYSTEHELTHVEQSMQSAEQLNGATCKVLEAQITG